MPGGGACPSLAGSAGVGGARRGCLPGWSPADLAVAVPAGGLPSLPPATPAFSLIFCPHPPAPPSPPGKGEILVFLMQGASPLASPGLDGTRHWLNPAFGGAWRGACPSLVGSASVGGALRGACPLCRLPLLPLACFSAPIPPTPFPAGRGRFWFFLCKGLRPLHPRGWMGRGTGSTCVWRCPAGGCLEGSVSAVGGSVSGCRGRSPRRNKLWGSPFPGGEGGWGDGGKRQG